MIGGVSSGNATMVLEFCTSFRDYVRLVIFLCGLLLTVKEELPDGHSFSEGTSTSSISFLLIAALISVLAITTIAVFDEAHRAASEPVARFTFSGNPVVFNRLAEGRRFHLFLSHVWSTGQDQVLSSNPRTYLLHLITYSPPHRCWRSKRNWSSWCQL